MSTVHTFTPATTDVFLDKSQPTTNKGSNTSIITFHDNDHFLIYFNLSSLSGIPNSKILSAKVKLNCYSATSSGNETMDIHRLGRAYVESEATWNEYSSGNAWTVAGADGAGTDRAAAFMYQALPSATTGIFHIYALNLVEFNLMRAAAGYGMVFKMEGDAGDLRYYWSSDTGTVANRPIMEVTVSAGGSQVIFVASRVQDFYNELMRGLLSPGALRRRYREVCQI